MFLNPNIFFPIWILTVLIFLGMRNLQEQVKKAFCCQRLFWPFTVWINCSRIFFSQSRSEQFWLQKTILLRSLIIILWTNFSFSCQQKSDGIGSFLQIASGIPIRKTDSSAFFLNYCEMLMRWPSKLLTYDLYTII